MPCSISCRKPGLPQVRSSWPIRRVEDAALALRPHPRVRLAAFLVDALHQHGAIDRVVARVDVGLVPGGERLQALHHRVIGRDDLGGELAGAVLLELAADDRDVARRLGEHERGAVDGDHRLAALDEVDQRLLLLRRDRLVVGVEHEAVVVLQRRRDQRLLGRRHVRHLDAAAGQRRGDERQQLAGRVMVAIVAEEQQAQRARLGRRRRRRGVAAPARRRWRPPPARRRGGRVESLRPRVVVIASLLSPASSARRGIFMSRNRRAWASMPLSVASRSMLEAPKNPAMPAGVREDVLGVLGLGNRPAVAEHDDVGAHRAGGVVHRLDAGRRLVERQRGLRPDRALGGQAEMGDEHVGAGLGHRLRAVAVEDVRARQQIELCAPRAPSRPRGRSSCRSPRGWRGRRRRSGRRWGSSGCRRSPSPSARAGGPG